MIKKIILVGALLFALLTPYALADAGPAPLTSPDDYIKIEFKPQSLETGIGEKLTIDVTVTNLSRERIYIVYMYFGLFGFNIDHSEEIINVGIDNLDIAPYESLSFEITDEISERVDCYKDGDFYYADTSAYMQFWAGEHTDDNFFYEWEEETIPVRINNLYDGSEFLEIEWLDNRDTLYFNTWYSDSYYDRGGGEYVSQCSIYYEVEFKNNSPIEIAGIQPDSQQSSYGNFSKYVVFDNIKDSYTKEIKNIFLIDGKYYCVTASREYGVEFIDFPQIDFEINLIKRSGMDSFTYEFLLTNTQDTALENLKIRAEDCAWNRYRFTTVDKEISSISPGETKRIEMTFDHEDALDNIRCGYFIDDMFYCWDLDCTYSDNEYIEVDSAVLDEGALRSIDFGYEKWLYDELNKTPTPCPTADATPSPTDMPTDSPTAMSAVTPRINVTNRTNPMVTALIFIAVLLAVAVIIVVQMMKRKWR